MYVKRVVLENVRGFAELDFDFERPDRTYEGWTVITGDNASGKTALLKAIAIALVGPDAAHSLQPSLSGWVKEGSDEATIAVQIQTDADDRFSIGRRYEKPFWAELTLKKTRNGNVSLEPGSKYKGKGKGPTHGPWAEVPDGWFCLGYGPFRRLYGASSEAQRIMSGPTRVARFATMFREDASLAEFEIWLKELHHKKLEGNERAERILDQVMQILNDDFLRHGLRVDKVDSEGIWLRHPNDVVLPLPDMSDGYRAALAMLADILRHMVLIGGDHELVMLDDPSSAVSCPGVVLIDEVDSHLHPEWQRRIGFWLKEKLPNIQFIVTTHSPIICQAADEDGLFHLPAPGDNAEPFRIGKEDYKKIVRGKPDAIYVSPAFDMEHTRSPRAVTKRREYAGLRSKQAAGRLTEMEQRQMTLDADWALTDE